MKTAIIEIEGIAPISFSRYHTEPQNEGEHADAYDKRTWRDKVHAYPDGRVYIPGVVLAKALISTAAQLGYKVPGRGSKRWGSVFKSGLMCPEPIDLFVKAPPRIVAGDQAPSGPRLIPVLKEDAEGAVGKPMDHVDVYCDAQGRPGSGRVWRRFPIVQPPWFGTATIIITNDEIPESVLRKHVEMCGQINGLGRYRPQNGGEFGRFKVTGFEWQDEARPRAA